MKSGEVGAAENRHGLELILPNYPQGGFGDERHSNRRRSLWSLPATRVLSSRNEGNKNGIADYPYTKVTPIGSNSQRHAISPAPYR